MAVCIRSVEPNSPAGRAGIPAESRLISINRQEIFDVLDFRFYQSEKRLTLKVEYNQKIKTYRIKKEEFEELGLCFDTYLMDEQRRCKNNCIFCFIDQMPKGMRESLYFKDDDSRLSFLFGNYITLTNISEHEIDRIIKLHISPINISVHTTNPALRCEMMQNRFAGDALSVIARLDAAGIRMNGQLVLCPNYNDKEELRRSLTDLLALPSMQSIAVVPVGLTGHREGLPLLEPFDQQSAAAVLDIIHEFGDHSLYLSGERRVYAADEFYLLAKREIPTSDFYGEFSQLENGVGMWSLLREEATEALDKLSDNEGPLTPRTVSIATGEAAFELLKNIVDNAAKKWHNLNGYVYPIENRFFGGKITVTGLITGGDLIEQLRDKPLGDSLLISASMLRYQKDKFLDDVTLQEVEKTLNIPVRVVENNGQELIDALLGN